jgi:hypothetical protein
MNLAEQKLKKLQDEITLHEIDKIKQDKDNTA